MLCEESEGKRPPNVSDDGPGVMIRDRTLAFGPKWIHLP